MGGILAGGLVNGGLLPGKLAGLANEADFAEFGDTGSLVGGLAFPVEPSEDPLRSPPRPVGDG